MNNPKCCDVDSVWVENVPGKGYFFCKECREEVLDFSKIVLEDPCIETTQITLDELSDNTSTIVSHFVSHFVTNKFFRMPSAQITLDSYTLCCGCNEKSRCSLHFIGET